MIAVIGNQSAGKSSLIESISGVTLPRSSGTCTRQGVFRRSGYVLTFVQMPHRVQALTLELAMEMLGKTPF